MVAEALKKNPQERYASIKAFVDDLQRSLKYEPISARPDAIAYRAGKFIRRHQSPVVAALVVTLALIGTTIFTWFFHGRSELLRTFKHRKNTAIVCDSPD